MKSDKVPLRKCIGCGTRRSKSDLIRIVKSPTNREHINIFICRGHAEGRGAYLCKNKNCLNKAKKSRRLERAFSSKIDEQIYNDLEKLVSESE